MNLHSYTLNKNFESNQVNLINSYHLKSCYESFAEFCLLRLKRFAVVHKLLFSTTSITKLFDSFVRNFYTPNHP